MTTLEYNNLKERLQKYTEDWTMEEGAFAVSNLEELECAKSILEDLYEDVSHILDKKNTTEDGTDYRINFKRKKNFMKEKHRKIVDPLGFMPDKGPTPDMPVNQGTGMGVSGGMGESLDEAKKKKKKLPDYFTLKVSEVRGFKPNPDEDYDIDEANYNRVIRAIKKKYGVGVLDVMWSPDDDDHPKKIEIQDIEWDIDEPDDFDESLDEARIDKSDIKNVNANKFLKYLRYNGDFQNGAFADDGRPENENGHINLWSQGCDANFDFTDKGGVNVYIRDDEGSISKRFKDIESFCKWFYDNDFTFTDDMGANIKKAFGIKPDKKELVWRKFEDKHYIGDDCDWPSLWHFDKVADLKTSEGNINSLYAKQLKTMRDIKKENKSSKNLDLNSYNYYIIGNNGGWSYVETTKDSQVDKLLAKTRNADADESLKEWREDNGYRQHVWIVIDSRNRDKVVEYIDREPDGEGDFDDPDLEYDEDDEYKPDYVLDWYFDTLDGADRFGDHLTELGFEYNIEETDDEPFNESKINESMISIKSGNISDDDAGQLIDFLEGEGFEWTVNGSTDELEIYGSPTELELIQDEFPSINFKANKKESFDDLCESLGIDTVNYNNPYYKKCDKVVRYYKDYLKLNDDYVINESNLNEKALTSASCKYTFDYDLLKEILIERGGKYYNEGKR